MNDVDLSLVVTAHDETAVCGPTMRSADLAVAAARARGVTVQTVVGLDRATPATREYFLSPRFDHWERRELEGGDLGLARNALLPQCEGRLVAFLDADDLFSENWLAEAVAFLDAAAERGERVVGHPELNVIFDGSLEVLVNTDQRSSQFLPEYLYVRHYYDSLCMAPREVHEEFPYVTRDVRNGLSYQDFQFTIETMAAGWEHRVVPDTIIFKRRRDFSLVTQSNTRRSVVRSLPEMAIDRIRSLGFRGR